MEPAKDHWLSVRGGGVEKTSSWLTFHVQTCHCHHKGPKRRRRKRDERRPCWDPTPPGPDWWQLQPQQQGAVGSAGQSDSPGPREWWRPGSLRSSSPGALHGFWCSQNEKTICEHGSHILNKSNQCFLNGTSLCESYFSFTRCYFFLFSSFEHLFL